jgi:hypothetical protein
MPLSTGTGLLGMNPIPFEIYEANMQFGKVAYRRPCVIVNRMKDGKVFAMAISSAMELCKGLPVHFTIDQTDPDFPGTGLKRTSYINLVDQYLMRPDELIRKRGHIEGDLLKRLLKRI